MPEAKSDAERINWAGVRDEYVTGTESFATIGKRYGVTKSAVEKHASDREANGGRTWGEWREEFRSEVSGQRTEISKRIKVETSAKTSMRHAEMLAELASDARAAVKEALQGCEPKDKVKLALAIIMAERRVHGLDRIPVDISGQINHEHTGKDGGPVEHEIDVGLDDDARSLAERALEAIFGKAP